VRFQDLRSLGKNSMGKAAPNCAPRQ